MCKISVNENIVESFRGEATLVWLTVTHPVDLNSMQTMQTSGRYSQSNAWAMVKVNTLEGDIADLIHKSKI